METPKEAHVKLSFGVVEDNFKDLKERFITNEIINQTFFQKTDKPLIEQTYLAELCGCDRRTIHRKLRKLEEDGWLTRKMVLNVKGHTTTQFTLTDKLKSLVYEIASDLIEEYLNNN